MSRSKLSVRKLKKLNHKGTLKEKVDLSNFTTYKCGGKAKIMVEINTLENFLRVVMYLEEINQKYFVLGCGSNVLVSDYGYDGVVIKLSGVLARIESLDDNVLECGAGVRLARVYVYARKLGLSGLEDSAGIPASVGGAVYMNASAYDFEMSKIVDYVVAYMNGKITYLDNTQVQFGYRHSVFQEVGGIILRVGLKFEPKSANDIDARFREIMLKRKDTQPIEYPSAGCVFKRREDVIVSKALDECGLKGLTFGGAKISEKHANFIINYNNATSQDIYELINVTKRRFRDKTGIDLETEIKFLGEFDETTG